jgi:hypothetical protein
LLRRLKETAGAGSYSLVVFKGRLRLGVLAFCGTVTGSRVWLQIGVEGLEIGDVGRSI